LTEPQFFGKLEKTKGTELPEQHKLFDLLQKLIQD